MRSRWRASSSLRRGIRKRERGISDVIATILLLALTVTLFAAIFAFVTTFPSPPAQNNNQFQASLFYPSNGTLKYVAGIKIVHLAGPQVPGSGLVYLKSANQPTAPEFQSPYTVSSGLGGATLWNLGQIWTLTFPLTQMPLAASNITIYIVSQSQLLFSVILPGTTFHTAPTVVSTAIIPATPIVGQSFTVYAVLSGGYKSNSVYVNLGSVPGAPATPQQMSLNGLGQWTYTVGSGLTKTNGTFYGFVNASGLNGTGQTAIGTVVITIGSNPGGTPITVEVVAIPQPPNANQVSTNYFAAVITYTGSSTNAALNVSFWVNQTPHTPFTAHSKTSTLLTGPAPPLTISGPSTVTVYATAPKVGAFSTWVLNSSVWVNVSATITGVGSATGSLPISTPNLVQGVVYYSKVPPNHGCSVTGPTYCGYANVTVWDNWTTALGGPSSLTFSGVIWVSNPSNGTKSWTISTTTVNQGSSVTVNPNAGRWKPSNSGSIIFYVTLTVYNGATIVGWIYDTAGYTAI